MSTQPQSDGRIVWESGTALTARYVENQLIELVFDKEAPSKKFLKVDAIDRDGRCLMLTRDPPTGRVMHAKGQIKDAYRIRVYLIDGLSADMREIDLPGRESRRFAVGPQGGTLIPIGSEEDDSRAVEVTRQSGTWTIEFLDGGRKVIAPSPYDVEVQAISPEPTQGQVRQLVIEKGLEPSVLVAKGDVEGAEYIRIAVKDSNEWSSRSGQLY